jgi:hypothetical protein
MDLKTCDTRIIEEILKNLSYFEIDNTLNIVKFTTDEILSIKKKIYAVRLKVIKSSQFVRYYVDKKLHREDGPAVEHFNGTKEWYRNGLLHRLDGPAVIYSDGTKEWWVNGKYMH